MDGYVNFLDTYLNDILFVTAIIFCIAFVVALVWIPYYFASARHAKKWRAIKRSGMTAAGHIISTYSRQRYSRPTDTTLGYWYTVHYAQYSFTDRLGRAHLGFFPQKKKCMYAAGDQVPVYYDPADPDTHCTDRHIEEASFIKAAIYGLCSFLALCGLAVIVCHFCLWQ